MDKIDKITLGITAVSAALNGTYGIGMYLFSDDTKITDPDIASGLLCAAADVLWIKYILKNN